MSNRVSTKGCSCSWRARDSEEIPLVCAVSGRAVPTFGGKNSESLQSLLWILLVLIAGRCLLTPVSLFPIVRLYCSKEHLVLVVLGLFSALVSLAQVCINQFSICCGSSFRATDHSKENSC